MTGKVDKEEIGDTVERKGIGDLVTAETDEMDDIEEIEVKKKEKEEKKKEIVKKAKSVGKKVESSGKNVKAKCKKKERTKLVR